MSPRTATRLARGLAALGLLFVLCGLAVSVGTASGSDIAADGFISVLALAFALLGTLIASRHPGNAIGWIFLGMAVATGLGVVIGAYAAYWADGNGGWDALGEAAAWYSNLSWIPFILVPPSLLLLLFPDGHLLSRRWRPVAWCVALGIGGTFVTEGLQPGPIADFPHLVNPYGVQSSLDPLLVLAFLLILVGMVGSAASLVVRFRRARGEQRQQIKWLALAGAVAAVTVPGATAGYDLWGETVTNTASMLGVLGVALAAGVAILRYRLYDIDIVINRTLVYGTLTVALGAAYLASVLVLQLVLSPLTQGSGLAVAVSTLAVAALFRPLRARIQALVDRRFYRRRYDVARTLDEFTVRLRHEFDLDNLGHDLQTVVRDTMQPTHVSVWLRRADR